MINNLKLRNVFSSLAYKIFLSKKKRFGNNLVALDYHYFTDNPITYPKLGLEVSYSVLEKQLAIFSEFFESLETDFALRTFIKKKINNSKPAILISIDDADKSIKYALKYFIKYATTIVADLLEPIKQCTKTSFNGFFSIKSIVILGLDDIYLQSQGLFEFFSIISIVIF